MVKSFEKGTGQPSESLNKAEKDKKKEVILGILFSEELSSDAFQEFKQEVKKITGYEFNFGIDDFTDDHEVELIKDWVEGLNDDELARLEVTLEGIKIEDHQNSQ